MIEEVKKTVLRGIRTVVFGNGVSKLLLILFELLLARALGASGFGIYSIAMSVLVLVAGLCLFGMNFGVIQFVSIYGEKNDRQAQGSVIVTGLCSVAGFGFLAGLALFFMSGVLANGFFSKPVLEIPLMMAAILIPVESINLYLSAVFRGLRQFGNNVLVLDLWRNLFLLLALPVIVLFEHRLELVFLTYALGALTGLFSGLAKLRRQGLLPGPSGVSLKAAGELFLFSRLLFLWNVLSVMSPRIFIIAAGVYLSSAETGVISVVFRLGLFMVFFQTAVNATVQAEFARFWSLGDKAGISALYQSVTRGLLGIAGGVALVLLAGSQEILGHFGHDYMPYVWIMWPLLLSEFMDVATGPAGQVLVACEKQKFLTGLTVFDIVLQFGLVLPLMAVFGLPGAVWGEMLRAFLFVGARLIILLKKIGIFPFSRDYFWLAGLWLLSLAAGFLTEKLPLAMIMSLGVYMIGGLLLLLRLPELRREIGVLLSFKRS